MLARIRGVHRGAQPVQLPGRRADVPRHVDDVDAKLGGRWLGVAHLAEPHRSPGRPAAGVHHQVGGHRLGRVAVGVLGSHADAGHPAAHPVARRTVTGSTAARGTVTNGPVTNGPVTNGTVINGPVINDPVTNGTVINDPVINDPVTNGTVTWGAVTRGGAAVGDEPVHHGGVNDLDSRQAGHPAPDHSLQGRAGDPDAG